MAMSFLDLALPVKAERVPRVKKDPIVKKAQVKITSKGILIFNGLASEHMGGSAVKQLAIGWDGDERLMLFMANPDPAKNASVRPLSYNAKTKVLLSRMEDVLGKVGYDYAGSGAQAFDLQTNAKGDYYMSLPTSLPPVPKREIKRRAKRTGKASGATEGAAPTSETPTAPVSQEAQVEADLVAISA